MADRCLICGGQVAEGQQVCRRCMVDFDIQAGEAVEIAEELRDISGVLSITANTDGNIKNCMESILRIADRLERKEDGEKGKTTIFAADSAGKAAHGKKL